MLGRKPVQVRFGVRLEEIEDISLAFCAIGSMFSGDDYFVAEVVVAVVVEMVII